MIESKLKANNCNRGQLFRPYWVSSARRSKLYEVISWLTDIHILTIRWWWPQMELESKFLPIGQLMSHAKRVTRDNWKNPEYHVVAAIRKLRTDTNRPAGKSWPNHVKNRSAMRTCVAYELPWSQRFFLPLRGSGSLILCRKKSRKSSVTGVLNSPFFTYHWNPVDFPVCRFGKPQEK